MVALVRDNSRWDGCGQAFLPGQVEPCIDGRVVALGSSIGQDVEVDDGEGDPSRWNTLRALRVVDRYAQSGQAVGRPDA